MQHQSTFQVYNASAGSGKTFTLVKEYLKILLQTSDVHRFQNILAITFTNKAAAEMKERVIHNLRDFAAVEILEAKSDMFKQIEQETRLADALIHQRSIRILQSILNNYSSFNITTIDSFTHRLIRSFAFDLGLSLNFEVEMDAKSLLNEAVDVLISKIGEDKELTKILIDFSLQKANEDKAWDISFELKEIASILLNENAILEVQKIKEKPLADFVDLKKKLHLKQQELEQKFTELGTEGLKIIENFEINHKDFYYAQFPKHFLHLINDVPKLSFDTSKGLGKSIQNKLFYTKGKPEEVKTAIDSIINPLLELYEQSELVYQEYALNKLFMQSLIPLAVLSKINAALDTLKDEKNVRLNAEFNQLISKNLREQPAAFIYERIGEKLKYYFIDEMQDTSGLQWQNLIPLIENALSQEHASLLLVGDAKQAIYRWRGGEAEQFINLASDTNTGNKNNPFFIPKQKNRLATNYRSYSEIINFNNDFFKSLSKRFNKPMYANMYNDENQQLTNTKKGGYVEISFLEEGLKAAERDEIYPEKVLEIINTVQPDFDKREICVLTRTRKQGVTIANYLAQNGVEIISSETLLLQNSAKVNFIIDLLSYLQQQSDKEAKIAVLYFLFEHLHIGIDKHSFFENMIDEPIDEFNKKLEAYDVYFDYQSFTQLPFYESIEQIIRSFRLAESSDAYLQFFLDEVLKFSQKSSDGIQGFLELWEQKKESLSIIAPDGKDAVRIMTIHKSKGLEFPVVIFPYDLDIYREQNPKIWYPIPEKDNYNDFDSLLINYNKSLEQTGAIGTKIYQAKRDELELDNFNLLYVTLTRAIEQLYIIKETKKEVDEPRFYSEFFRDYLVSQGRYNPQETMYSFGVRDRVSKKSLQSEKSYELQEFISSPWQEHNINVAVNAQLFWDESKQEAIAFGNLMHEILAKIKTENDLKDTLEHYQLLGLIQEVMLPKIEKIVTEVIRHPRLKSYFEQNNTVYNEREILTDSGEIIIPDRLVINALNEAVIIDYKTGKSDRKYHQQLEKYADAIHQLGFKVNKKLLVYLGESIEIEEV